MRTIFLHGEVGELFGKEWRLEVSSPAEAFRAIDCIKPGFLNYFKENAYALYNIIVGDENYLTPQELLFEFTEEQSFHVYPVVQGSKNWFSAVVGGLVFLGAVVFTGGLGLAALGSFSAFGAAAATTLTTVGWGSFFASFGLSMAFSGIASMMTSQSSKSSTPQEQKASYIFSGAINTSRQGGPIPIGYGEMVIGSQVVSLCVRNRQVDAEGTDKLSPTDTVANPWRKQL